MACRTGSISVPSRRLTSSRARKGYSGFRRTAEGGRTVRVRAEADTSADAAPPKYVCMACGLAREEDKLCDGSGRIIGGIGSVPGFRWWPIKAYRPCPRLVESGGKYQRSGQSLDEVMFGRKG